MDRDKVTIGHAQKTQSLLWKEVVKAMAERDNLRLLDGGDSVGMTDNQYKGMLLDQLEDWQEILDRGSRCKKSFPAHRPHAASLRLARDRH